MTTKKKLKHPSRTKQQAEPRNKPSRYDEDVIFSFKYLDLHGTQKFSIAGCGENYIEKLLLRLKDVSTIRYDDFIKLRSPSLRTHEINWPDTTEPQGFTCLNTALRNQLAWQFEISANEHGRVHGFLLDRIFYVVWLDPYHRLYL